MTVFLAAFSSRDARFVHWQEREMGLSTADRPELPTPILLDSSAPREQNPNTLHRPPSTSSPSPLRGNRSIAIHLFPVTRASSFRRLQIGSIIPCSLVVVKLGPLVRLPLRVHFVMSHPRRNSRCPLARSAIPSRRIGARAPLEVGQKRLLRRSTKEREKESGRSMIVFLRLAAASGRAGVAN